MNYGATKAGVARQLFATISFMQAAPEKHHCKFFWKSKNEKKNYV